jgi:hypothetical protein
MSATIKRRELSTISYKDNCINAYFNLITQSLSGLVKIALSKKIKREYYRGIAQD